MQTELLRETCIFLNRNLFKNKCTSDYKKGTDEIISVVKKKSNEKDVGYISHLKKVFQL